MSYLIQLVNAEDLLEDNWINSTENMSSSPVQGNAKFLSLSLSAIGLMSIMLVSSLTHFHTILASQM